MQNLLKDFNPFFSTENDQNSDPNNKNNMTYLKGLDDPNYIVVVDRGSQEDCKRTQDYLNSMMQQYVQDFMLKNIDQFIAELNDIKQNNV